MANDERQRRLRRYQQKDYSSLVEFPVEIVGRDGVVRAFTFEDAVRLYQRRITSAADRFDDASTVEAEVWHCRRRIRQLRRSYLLRHTWAAVRSIGDREGLGGEMAAEVAAFLRRFTARRGENPEAFRFAAVEGGTPARVYWLTRDDGHPAVLYVYRFEGSGADVAREAFGRFVASLRHARPSEEGTEHLLSAWQAVDCGILLTTRASPEEAVAGADTVPPLDPDHVEDPFAHALQDLREGEAEPALEALSRLLEARPDHRDAALAASLAADLLGRREEAELYARLACRHHPGDPALLHQLGVVLVRQNRLAEARVPLEEALGHDPSLFGARFLLVLLELHRGRTGRAHEHLQAATATAEPQQRDLLAALGRFRNRVVRRRRLLGLVALIAAGGVAGGVAGWTPGWVLALLALLVAWRLVRPGGRPPATPSIPLPDDEPATGAFRTRPNARAVQ